MQIRAQEAQRNQVSGGCCFLKKKMAGPILYPVAITTDVLVYDGAAAEVSSLMRKPCTKLGDGEGAAIWPRRTFDRQYRLRLVTFEPAKLQKAIPISVCARWGLTGLSRLHGIGGEPRRV